MACCLETSHKQPSFPSQEPFLTSAVRRKPVRISQTGDAVSRKRLVTDFFYFFKKVFKISVLCSLAAAVFRPGSD